MRFTQRLKQIFSSRSRHSVRDERLDPLDNQYRRMQFENKAAGGLNGQMMRRVANFTNPKRLDEED
jgi:hypothetical protein